MRTAAHILLALMLSSIVASQPSMRTISEEYPDRFSIEAEYPRFYDKDPVSDAANKTIGDWASKLQTDFTSKALSQVRQLGVPSEQYESKIESEITYHAPKRLISVTCDTYEYLGGAHGISAYRVFNFGDVRGKAKQLTLADLFKKGSDYKKQVSKLVLAKLKEDEEATLVQSGNVKTLTDAQLNRFQVHSDGLTFLFDHYEVAPYSNGRFLVKLSTEELGPTFERAKDLTD